MRSSVCICRDTANGLNKNDLKLMRILLNNFKIFARQIFRKKILSTFLSPRAFRHFCYNTQTCSTDSFPHMDDVHSFGLPCSK